jgi:multiple sugar transport system substrate-binding protein
MKKSILAVLLCCAAIPLFAGGGKPESSAKAPAGAKEVVFWNTKFEDWNMEFFEKIADEYNAANRGYYVIQSFEGSGDEKLNAAIAAGTGPDGYIIPPNNIYSRVIRGEIKPLNGLVPQEALDDIYDSVKKVITFNGKIWAYPELVEPSALLFYRTDLFEKAGLTRAPKTWDELVEYAKKVMTPDTFGLSIGRWGDQSLFSIAFQIANIGHLMIDDNWDRPLIDQGYKDLALFYKRLYQENIVPREAIAGYNELMPFGTGQAAMQITGSWGVAQILNDYPEMADKFAVAPIPTKTGEQDVPSSTLGGWYMVIDARSANPEGMADFIHYALGSDPARMAEFFKIARYSKVTPRKSVDDYIKKNIPASRWQPVLDYVASRGIPEPVIPIDIRNAASKMFESVAMAGVDVDAAAREAINTINEYIRINRTAGKNPLPLNK